MTDRAETAPPSLRDVAEAIAACNRCGSCQAVCPVYAESVVETDVARGKVQLAAGVLEGSLPPDAETASALATCTTCMACHVVCPSGVEVARIVTAARAAVAEANGLPWLKRALFAGVRRPSLVRAAAEAAARLQGAAFTSTADRELRRLRFPYGLVARRLYPPLAVEPFPFVRAAPHEGAARSAGRESRAERPRALFFPGCMVTFVYPDIGHAAVSVMRRAGATVLTPPAYACCGFPLEAHGDLAGAKQLARHQLDQLAHLDFDHLVAACPTCVSSFVHRYVRLLADEPAYVARAARLAERAYDVTSYLVDVLRLEPTGSLSADVTYHDPCHLVRGLGVRGQPRRLLDGVTGLRVMEMDEPARCCAGAGSFALTHAELSIAIGARKAADIVGTGADVVATACPGCKMQLADVLFRAGERRPVVHVVELLAADSAATTDATGVWCRPQEA